MNGIFMETPFAKLVLRGEKKWDFKKLKPPNGRIGKPLYLICDEGIIGEIMIPSYKYNQVKHSYYLEFFILKRYESPKQYQALTSGEWPTEITVG